MSNGWTVCAAVCAVTMALTGCGGGDGGSSGVGSVAEAAPADNSPIQTPGTSASGSTATVVSPFLGIWNYPERYCTDNWPVVPASENSQKGVMPVNYEFTETTMSYTHEIYSDLKCTQLEGTVTLTGSIQWEAASISGWNNPVRVTTTYSGYKVTGNIAVSEVEAKAEFGEAAKNILGISGKQLFAGNHSTDGADGFPTAFREKPLAQR